MSRPLPAIKLTPVGTGGFNPASLPPLPLGVMPDVGSSLASMTAMVTGITAATSEFEPYDFSTFDHRHIIIPNSIQHPNRKLEGAPRAAYLARLTLLGEQRYALDTEDGLWVCWQGQWRPTTDLLAITGGKGDGYDAFVRSILEAYDGQLPRLQLGARFDNVGLLRGGGVVTPDDPRFYAPWAMDFEGEEYSAERAEYGLAKARTVTASDNDARMLCRVAAAPLMRDHLQYIYDLLGEGGNGKGLFLNALLDLYSDLGSRFSLAAFAGIGKTSPTSYETASIPLTNHLLAVDTDAPDPGLGDQERMKKAATGEGVDSRRLGSHVDVVPTTAVIVIASNRTPSIASDASQTRRWRYVNFDKSGAPVERWYDALHGENLALDLFMAGCAEWARDPVGVNPAPNLVNDLDDWGTELMARLIEVGEPDPETGFDPDAYLPSSCLRTPESPREKAAQLGMLGLESRTKRDVLHLAGDEPKVCRCFVIADPERFARFAATVPPEPEPEPTPDPAPDELTALGLIERDFGAVETQLGAMGWTGNVFPLRGQGDNAKAPAVALEPMLRTPATHVADHCEHDEPMRGFAPAPGFMVLDLDIPKGADEGKPDGYGVLRTLGVGIGDPALVVRTGSGGYHLYYRIPDGADIPQIAHKGASAPLPGLPAYEGGVPIDTRVGGHGFVVMPGSVASDGRSWQVVREGSIDGDHTLPADLLALIQRLAHLGSKPVPRPDRPSTPVDDDTALARLDMAPVPEGRRNEAMRDQVWFWLNLVRRHGLPRSLMEEGLDRIYERFRASGLSDREIGDCIRHSMEKMEGGVA